MRRSDAFPSQYLGKDDVSAPKVVTIEDVQMQEVKGDGGNESKPVIYFKDFPKPMILNNVNWMTIELEYGDDSDQWQGKRVELYVDPNIVFGNKRVGGVRMRIPSNGAASRPAMAALADWSLDQAVQKCADAGISKPELIAHLKEKGLNGYNPARDTATVQAFIRSKQADAAFGDEQVFTADEVPF